SHPELLDWLAVQFMDAGWSVKALHRLILLTRAYQMQSVPNAKAFQTDPGNRLLWRMPRRRLDAESLRDTLLDVSGRLDRSLGGGEASELLYKEADVVDDQRGFRTNRWRTSHPFYAQCVRRSLYLPVVRNVL